MASLQAGQAGLPKLVLVTPKGAQAQVYAHGAHVTAWVPPDGRERLFLSSRSEFQEGKAIRGGIPVCFPQFSGLGSLPKHGFARSLPWQMVDTPAQDSTVALLRLSDSDQTRALWPHAFETTLTITLTDSSLTLALTVSNPGRAAFEFTTALHTYLRVADIAATRVEGLAGLSYFDQVTSTANNLQPPGPLFFSSEVDRIYYQSPPALALHNADQAVRVSQTGFRDSVLWNPWIEKGSALADLEPEGYRHFACIEAAAIGQPINLEPGQSWSGSQSLQL